VLTGIASTATYFAVSLMLIAPPVMLDPVLASAGAFGISLVVSYLGHHRYTFEREGRHGFYLPRFITVTVLLFVSSTLAMFIFTHVVATEPLYVTIAITLTYPIASYVLNLLWVFKLR
jgi:putative flippase GtrA